MNTDIRLFTSRFSGADSLLVEFFRNQPGYRPAEYQAAKDRGPDGYTRNVAQHERGSDSGAHEDRRYDRV